MSIVCAHQPDFLPYLGFFERLITAEIFVIMDDVQLIKRGWHNRNKIKNGDSELWLSVPIQRKGRRFQSINEAQIDNESPWQKKMLRSIEQNYSKAIHFDSYYPQFSSLLDADYQSLLTLNMNLLHFLISAFEIQIKIVYASELNITGKKNEYLIEATHAVQGTEYLSGSGAREYLDEEMFQKANIKVHWQDFHHPVYPQGSGKFLPFLSAIDLLFHCGPESKSYLAQASTQTSFHKESYHDNA